ncbi:MAG: hypothetical protein N3F05_01775 [Candidatus Diapherotrites archaeon]|nr:hypothetical protein [Candidatus Diapherotrites archaeon]
MLTLSKIFLGIVIDTTFYSIATFLGILSFICLINFVIKPNIIEFFVFILGIAIYVTHLRKKEHRLPLSARFFSLEVRGSKEFGHLILREIADFGASVGIPFVFLILLTVNFDLVDKSSLYLKIADSFDLDLALSMYQWCSIIIYYFMLAFSRPLLSLF